MTGHFLINLYVDSLSINNALSFSVRCYASLSDGENDFIALEDLSFDGYKTTDRASGFDFNHCKQIMATLGKFHAISLAIRDQEPEELNKMIDFVEVIFMFLLID